MIEFNVNSYITLKLENRKTNVYVNGVLFNQCKYILTRKKIFELGDLREIQSVDELADSSIDDIARNLDHYLEYVEPEFIDIPVKTRFWVHCSNLQVWVENNYDTKLLHSNLSFPLLKTLVEIGDPIAKKVFKEEIAKRFASNYPSVINFLTEKGYDDYLNRAEFYNSIILPTQADVMIELEKIVKIRYCLTDKIEYLHREVVDDKQYFTVKDRNVSRLEINYDKSYPEFLLDLLHNLNNLKELNLFINENTDNFPKISHNCDSLQNLRIGVYGLTEIPNIFEKFPNLKKLVILGGKASHNFDSLNILKSLESLAFLDIRTKRLPKKIGNLRLRKKLSYSQRKRKRLYYQ